VRKRYERARVLTPLELEQAWGEYREHNRLAQAAYYRIKAHERLLATHAGERLGEGE